MQQGSILSFFKKTGSSRPGEPYPDASRPSPNSRPKSTKQPRGPDRRRNIHLKKVADETKATLPQILADLPHFDPASSSVHHLNHLAPLDAKECPGFVLPHGDAEAGKKGTRIKVWDMDTFDAALKLNPNYKVHTHLGPLGGAIADNDTDTEPEDTDNLPSSNSTDHNEPSQETTTTTTTTATTPSPKPVAVLNLASERSPGGGWQNGALAQEETLCYRSSLSLSLDKSHYPLPSFSAIHTPSVLIIRTSLSTGHVLLTPTISPSSLPVVAVISVAALRRPDLTPDLKRFKTDALREATRKKIRLTLRLAAKKGHTKLVLGALGCGVFGNPPGEVAACFLDVLREKEFEGGWWDDIVFAVLDNVGRADGGGRDGNGNFGHFFRQLHGEVV